MTRTVNGDLLFEDREKEMLRKMMHTVADFCGVQVLTYCIMSNHFHVLVKVPSIALVPDKELMRRYKVLYPKPTKYQAESAKQMELTLSEGGEEAELIRTKLLARMADVSEFMKALKQRFSIWYNRSHRRYGTLWAERFKSVLVEGEGTALQTIAAYIDLNPVRAGLVDDPKDYRFCGYAEAVAGVAEARSGLKRVWANHGRNYLQAHRQLLFGKGASPWTHRGKVINHTKALKVLETENGVLSKAAVLRCRVRYFSDGAILGSSEFVRSFVGAWQLERGRKHPPKVNQLRGAHWGDLSVIQGLRKEIFG